MELSVDQYNDLPDYAKEGFAESEGKYIPAKDATLKATLDNLDKEKKSLEAKVGELSKGEETRLAELEAAKATARDEAIKEAAEKQDWSEQERLLREKFEDELRREKESVRGEVTKEFTVKQASESLDSDIKLLAAELAVDEDSKVALQILIGNRAKLDDNGNRVYYGEDGSALSITELKAFKEEVSASKSLSKLVKGTIPTTGGGFSEGNGSGGHGSKSNPKADAAIKAGDLQGYLKAKLN